MTTQPKVLIVDDDLVVRHLLSAMLQGSGYDVHAVDSGGACLEYLRASKTSGTPPNTIFLDLMLGDMPGTEVMKEIRVIFDSQPIPIIMLSANPQIETLGIEPGLKPDFYLEKPFVKATVLSALSTVLGQI